MTFRHLLAFGTALAAAAGLAGAAIAGPLLTAPAAPDNRPPLVLVSKTGDKVAAGVAGAVVGGLIGAAIANSDKYGPSYPPSYAPAPGYYPPPPPPPAYYGTDAAWRTCVDYGNVYSRKGGAMGLRLDNIVSIMPSGYNRYVVSAYMSVLWPGYQTRTYVTCTVTNGTVTSWRAA